MSSQNDPLKAIITGGIVGGLETFISYPFEYIKTQMQLNHQDAVKGIKYITTSTYQRFGIKGYYRGLDILIALTIPKTAVRFSTNEFLKNNVFTNRKNKLHAFMAGLGAGITDAIVVTTPAETLKTILIHDKLQPQPQYNSLFGGIYKIIRQQGGKRLFKGLAATIVRQGSNQGIWFMAYPEFEKKLKNVISFQPGVKLLSGAMAGVLSVYGNHPIDIIKTKMQGLETKKYKNVFDCGFKIVKENGIPGLYKGVVPRLIKIAMHVGLTFTLYDYSTIFIKKFWPSQNDKKQL